MAHPLFRFLVKIGRRDSRSSVTNNEPTIALMGDNGSPRALWRVLADGSASLAFSGSQGQQRLVIATDKEGRPSIRFIDANNKVVKELK